VRDPSADVAPRVADDRRRGRLAGAASRASRLLPAARDGDQAMIAGLLDSGAMPTLERVVQFTGKRHGRLVADIANFSTPYFKPTDLDVEGFQAALGEAVDRRRRSPNTMRGELRLRDTSQLEFRPDGLGVKAGAMNENILFHDRNNRDVERIMQRLAENTMTHNVAVDMLKNQFDMLKLAIRERL
jgi:flagellar basal-body rod protein FlgB